MKDTTLASINILEPIVIGDSWLKVFISVFINATTHTTALRCKKIDALVLSIRISISPQKEASSIKLSCRLPGDEH